MRGRNPKKLEGCGAGTGWHSLPLGSGMCDRNSMKTHTENSPLPLVLRFGFDRFIVDVQVDPTHEKVQQAISSPKALMKLAECICETHGREFRDGLDQPLLRGLPNLGPLDGRWVAGSPMGMEHTIPAPGWCFDERLSLAKTNPHEFALLEGDMSKDINSEYGRGKDITVEEFSRAIGEAVSKGLARDAVVGVVQHNRARSAFDELLDQI